MIMALPLRILWALRIDMRQKFALAGIFCLGFIVIIFSIVRAITTSMSLTNEWSLKESDPVWLALWSVLESTIAVCVSCLPSFRLLYTDKNKSPSNQSPIDSNNPPTIGSGSSKKSGIRKATSVTVMSSRHSRLGSHDSIEMSQSSTLSPATQTTSSGWTTLSDEKNRARSPTIVEPPAENIYTHEELEEDEPPPRPGTLAQEEEGPYELDARGNRTPRTPRSPSSPAPVYAPPGNSYETTMKRASHGSMV
ncbi:MAG: hypothetical protein M1827_003546 [Pycnora praestabilis]|nr:MAG: hypothetical protein M1827_003546 [Pycnora praestabilis]